MSMKRFKPAWRPFLASSFLSLVMVTLFLVWVAPRLVMIVAQNRFTSVDEVTDVGRAPLNSISHTHRFPTPDDKIIVRPNADTFYSSGWYTLDEGPLLIHVPEVRDRYYSIQLNDSWTNAFGYIGTRATGEEAGDYAVVGPGWTGTLPEGVQRFDSPTNILWIIGRTMVFGPDDVDNVAAIQEQIEIKRFKTEG